MIKLTTIILALMISLLTATTARAAQWEVSVDGASISGCFDYILHYNSDASQVLSRVTLPQNQTMTILNARYYTDDNDYFVNLQYGDTGLGWKGRGSDSDWTNPGSNALTDYGDMDSYGSQKIYGVDIGMIFAELDNQTITASAGWGRQETTNELRNVVYHLSDSHPVGNQSQRDNGSTLKGEFSGFYVEAADDVALNSNLHLNLSLTLFQTNAQAFGHWTNHDPVWNWVDRGSAIGYKVKAELKYTVWRNCRGKLGYFYNYLEAEDCIEVLNGVTLPNAVDLRYEQSGFYAGFTYLF